MNLKLSLLVSLFFSLLVLPACEKEEVSMADDHVPTNIIRCSQFQEINYGPATDTLFVDINHTSANDNNSGSDINNPLKTISKAIEKAAEGTIILVRQGTYNEGSLIFTKSGQLDKPIILSAYPTTSDYENVVLDGTGQGAETIGILFDGGVGNISIVGLTITNMPYAGIASNDEPSLHYENITLKDLIIENTGSNSNPGTGYGIILYAPKSFRIINVESSKNNLDGISVWGIGTALYAENGFIIDCHAHHNDDGVNGWEADAHGIAINQGRNIGVCNCLANDNSDHGFDASDYPKAGKISTNIAFEENTSYNNQNIGFATNSDSRSILYLRNITYNNNWGFGCYEGVGTVHYYHNIALKNKYGLYLDDDYANYVDPGDNSIYFTNNVFYENELKDLFQNGNGYRLTFSHNDFFSSSNAVLVELRNESYTSSNISDLGDNNINEPPMFLNDNLSSLDLQLENNSLLIDAGKDITLNNILLSFSGTAPDIGVEEK